MFLAGCFFLLCVGILASADFQCQIVPGRLKQIDAGAGEVYGVNDIDDIYHWVDNNWKQVPGKLIHVSVGPAGLWGVNKDYTIFKYKVSDWMSVTGALKQIDAGGNKFVSGVNAQDNIFCLRQSCTISDSSAVIFNQVDGALRYYSCGPIGCWGTNKDQSIFYRYNVTPTSCEGTRWQQVDGLLTMVEVSTDGLVYGVNAGGDLYRRDGITADTPTGTGWTKLDFCAVFKHVTYDNGILWIINTSGEIYRCANKI
ncbi:fish-egg lectin-like [Pyxicephalus adspersus]|uniref:fish-egg lectin-like n=1 Tax=Pyxicephalus adspersus TaxID=30357 RepID=UPI003B592FEF